MHVHVQRTGHTTVTNLDSTVEKASADRARALGHAPGLPAAAVQRVDPLPQPDWRADAPWEVAAGFALAACEAEPSSPKRRLRDTTKALIDAAADHHA
ncbi:hypothetical protein ACWDG1_44430 [Streptomyces sp. NPDC001177]